MKGLNCSKAKSRVVIVATSASLLMASMFAVAFDRGVPTAEQWKFDCNIDGASGGGGPFSTREAALASAGKYCDSGSAITVASI